MLDPKGTVPLKAMYAQEGSPSVCLSFKTPHFTPPHPSGRSSGSEPPGPPVEGALLRIDEWILDVDEQGLPLRVRVGEQRMVLLSCISINECFHMHTHPLHCTRVPCSSFIAVPPSPFNTIQAYDEADPSDVNVRTISRRDANAFARAAR